jgi:nitrogen fixation/metabolism regulation signal transduction histidine kinase
LFAVVFAIAILVAYLLAQRIALPLNIIRKQMSLVKIGERNQALQWDRNDEIGLLVREYNKMLDELDASLNRLAESERQGAWREMAKQVAHEIKNPLTPMRLSLQHLQYSIQRDDDNLKEKIQKTSDLLIRQIDALSEMAEEFSSFAKMPDPQLGLVNLTQTLRDSVALMGRENSVKPKILGELIDYTIWADANMLVRIFNNILKNAVQAIPDDREGAITVWLEEINDTDVSNFRWIAVNIKDNGKGIPDSLRERIFSPNFSTKNSGMGLGLAMVKKMVEQFGGEINYTTQVEVGTTFVVKFPIKSGSDS